MAHINREDKAPALKSYTVYVLMFPKKVCYIGKCKTGNERGAYKEHYNLRNHYTQEYVAREKEAGRKPKMFLLTQVETHNRGFQPYQIAWTKYLLARGWKLVAEQFLDRYTEDLRGVAAAEYERIKDMPFAEAFAPELELCPDYGAGHKVKDGERTLISFKVDAEDYRAISERAKSCGMNLSHYCREAAMYGEIIIPDCDVAMRYTTALNDIKEALRRILWVMYVRGQYYPKDLAEIQEHIDRLSELQTQAHNIIDEAFFALKSRNRKFVSKD